MEQLRKNILSDPRVTDVAVNDDNDIHICTTLHKDEGNHRLIRSLSGYIHRNTDKTYGLSIDVESEFKEQSESDNMYLMYVNKADKLMSYLLFYGTLLSTDMEDIIEFYNEIKNGENTKEEILNGLWESAKSKPDCTKDEFLERIRIPSDLVYKREEKEDNKNGHSLVGW